MYCFTCCNELPEGANFCPKCGTPVAQNIENGIKLTDTPVFIKKGTSGSIGTEGEYVLFGDWPQTIKDKNVSIDESKFYNFNGQICFKGSDEAFYVKQNCCPHDFWDEDEICPSTFSNGEELIDGNDYYFKIEPIKWRVLSKNYQSGIFLLAENVLINASSYFLGDSNDNRVINNKTVSANNYEFSNIRAYLNGLNGKSYEAGNYSNTGFLNSAFSFTAQKIINNTFLENCNNISDKVFIISKNDITNDSFGFSSDTGKLAARQRQYTDFAKGCGVFAEPNKGYEKYTYWWLRDRVENKIDCNFYVNTLGDIKEYEHVIVSLVGIVPAIVISEK